ncbi:hypothetical protein [Microcoleus sp. bin38.metabat.b11b12b14.051]|uniref:hypothetical protein n=1 Tax=Microcoleus sp. bin38.metabat.b11b12b14.051 TaxID=2742709 RepID=UPI0025EC2643|nr:hypothetical protein [Microcoleus sp. bin38.metabat.b11b12b14.051]
MKTGHYFPPLLVLTALTAVLGLGKSGALAAVWNILETEPCWQLHRVQMAAKGDRNFQTSKGTLKAGSALSVDPDEVIPFF